MKIEFYDNNERRIWVKDGYYVAEIIGVQVYEDNKNNKYFLRIIFLLDSGNKISGIYPTEKKERWKLKMLLKSVGIEKKDNKYSFDTDELVGKKTMLYIEGGKIKRTYTVDYKSKPTT